MANDSNGATSIVAIFAIILMLGFAGFVAWRAGVFGSEAAADRGDKLEINVNAR